MTSTAHPPAPPSAKELLKHPAALFILLAMFLHTTATSAQAIALGKQVYDMTGRKLDLGWIGLAEFAPTALLVFVAGSVADRFDRRKIAAIGLMGEVLSSIGLAIYARSHPTSVWPIIALVVFFGTSRGFTSPAIRSMVPSTVPENLLPRISAVSSSMWTTAGIGGPILGGFLYAVNPSLPYWFAASILVLGAGAALCINKQIEAHKQHAERPKMSTAFDGLHFVRRTPLLLSAISLDLFAVLFGGAVALLPAIAKDRLHVGSTGLGYLRASASVGASAMAIVLAVRPVTKGIGRKLLIAVGVFGVATIVLGVTNNFAVAVGALLILSAADMISVFIRSTLVPLATPTEMRGRVTAVEQVFIGASNELGAFESGMAAQLMGTVWGIVSGGIATIVIVGVWWRHFPALRDIDTFDDVTRQDA